jgi:hypothetical protein
MEQQYAPLAGKSGSTRLEGHHRIIHILRILSTDLHSQRMISRKMDKADRGVSQPNETVSKGEKVGGKFLP